VEAGKDLSDTWHVVSSYDLSVYGPNGFLRSFSGSIGSHAALLDVVSSYGTHGRGEIALAITNVTHVQAEVTVVDAYTGRSVTALVDPLQTFEDKRPIAEFGGWYDRIVKVSADASFKYELAGHVETGEDSISDPALGGLVTLTA
jgi:phospholipase C